MISKPQSPNYSAQSPSTQNRHYWPWADKLHARRSAIAATQGPSIGSFADTRAALDKLLADAADLPTALASQAFVERSPRCSPTPPRPPACWALLHGWAMIATRARCYWPSRRPSTASPSWARRPGAGDPQRGQTHVRTAHQSRKTLIHPNRGTTMTNALQTIPRTRSRHARC